MARLWAGWLLAAAVCGTTTGYLIALENATDPSSGPLVVPSATSPVR